MAFRAKRCWIEALRRVQHSSDAPSFASEYIKRAGGGGSVHHFQSDAAAGKREHQFSRWKLALGTGAKDNELGRVIKQGAKVVYDQITQGNVLPLSNDFVGRQCDGSQPEILIDADAVFANAADRQCAGQFSCEFQLRFPYHLRSS